MAKTPIKYYVVDAFTELAFKGNPAAVCLLDEERERDEDWLQSLAAEFNVSQTAYFTPIPHSPSRLTPRFRLRWFTALTEVKLCGHATLASAHILFSTGLVDSDLIEFETLSGILTAKRINPDKSSTQNANGGENGGFMIQLDFPVVPVTDHSSTAIDASAISKALNGATIIDIKRTATANDLLVELASGKAVSEFQPQFHEIKKCPERGIIVTAVAPPESGFDFISRFFCPKFGINEDPVCGSVHCSLAPYWSEKLGKSDFVAYQASPRGGILKLQLDKQTQRVLLQGRAVTVMEGFILV